MIARHLATRGLLEPFAQQVRLVRGCFGSYELIDFLGPLVGYAISGGRTLTNFFEREQHNFSLHVPYPLCSFFLCSSCEQQSYRKQSSFSILLFVPLFTLRQVGIL